MKKSAILLACVMLAACSQGVNNDKRVWGGQTHSSYDLDYNRKAETKLIESKTIMSGSECIGQNLDGICHGTVIPNK